jgi:hypothetical protein
MLVLGRAAVVPELADPGQQCLVVAGDGACVAVGAEVLAGIEAEAGEIPDASAPLAVDLGAMGLRGVLDEGQAMTRRDRTELRHVRRLAVEVDRDDGPRPRADRRLDAVGIEVERARMDVHEDRRRPDVADRLGRGNERVSGRDDLVALADTTGPQGQLERRGPGRQAHGAARPDEPGKRALEIGDLPAQDERGRVEDAGNGGIDVRAYLRVLGGQVDERDAARADGRGGHVSSVMR